MTMGQGALLEPDSFLIKGEEMPAHSWWGGNPAMEIDDQLPRIHRNRNDNNWGAALIGGR